MFMAAKHHPRAAMSRDGPAAPGRSRTDLWGLKAAEYASDLAPGRRTKRPEQQHAEAQMTVLGLGYAGFGSDALDDWRQFGTSLIGLQAVERGNSLLAFRMD